MARKQSTCKTCGEKFTDFWAAPGPTATRTSFCGRKCTPIMVPMLPRQLSLVINAVDAFIEHGYDVLNVNTKDKTWVSEDIYSYGELLRCSEQLKAFDNTTGGIGQWELMTKEELDVETSKTSFVGR